MDRDDYCTTLPPWAVQLATSVVSVQPWPLQAFWPLQDDEPILQALWPLHALTPLHFTPSACAAVANEPAAKIAAAAAKTVRLVMSRSLMSAQRRYADAAGRTCIPTTRIAKTSISSERSRFG